MELWPYVKSCLRMHRAICEHVGNQRATLFIDVLKSALESDATSADDMQNLIKGLARESSKEKVARVIDADEVVKMAYDTQMMC